MVWVGMIQPQAGVRLGLDEFCVLGCQCLRRMIRFQGGSKRVVFKTCIGISVAELESGSRCSCTGRQALL